MGQFLSTLPVRGATSPGGILCISPAFLSTLPVRGATRPARPGVYSVHRFLSTLPARGATKAPAWGPAPPKDFYPRSPRGERHAVDGGAVAVLQISIHAPREGSDDTTIAAYQALGLFLSTLPARGATIGRGRRCTRTSFLSTLPVRGATVDYIVKPKAYIEFLSTLPARGATARCSGSRC